MFAERKNLYGETVRELGILFLAFGVLYTVYETPGLSWKTILLVILFWIGVGTLSISVGIRWELTGGNDLAIERRKEASWPEQ